jgi:hypothetical protein
MFPLRDRLEDAFEFLLHLGWLEDLATVFRSEDDVVLEVIETMG